VFDLETGGFTPVDGDVLEIGWTDVSIPDYAISEPQSYLCGTSRKITPENRAVHHINPATLTGKAPFDAAAFNAKAVEDGVTCFAAYNSTFDCQWLEPTLPVICVYKAALRAWPEFGSHGNSAVFYALEDGGRCHGANYAHIVAHRAGPDSYVTAWNLKALLQDGHTGSQMIKWTKEPALLPRCPIGKFRGKPWAEVEFGFLEWMTRQADMEPDFKWNAERELDRRFNH
jgi:exodeoxyribonuclease X